jgi:hypothetical protein
MQSDNHRARAGNPNRLAQITLQNRAPAVDEQVDAFPGKRYPRVSLLRCAYVDLKEPDIRYVPLGCQLTGQVQISWFTLDADYGTTARGEAECEFTMSAAKIQYVAVRTKILLDQGDERIFGSRSQPSMSSARAYLVIFSFFPDALSTVAETACPPISDVFVAWLATQCIPLTVFYPPLIPAKRQRHFAWVNGPRLLPAGHYRVILPASDW